MLCIMCMQDVEDRLVSLDSRQSALIQGAQNDLVIAWEDAEVALQVGMPLLHSCTL